MTRFRPVGNSLRWLLGAGSLVAGFTWMLINLGTESVLFDAGVGAVLAGGGLVLLMPHRIRLPRAATAIVMTAAALVGAAAGSFSSKTQQCCMFAEITDRGWPFRWLQRGALADDPATAHRLAQSSDWHVDLVALTGTLLVFAYAGMLLVVLVVLIRRREGKTADSAR
jgi:hypothetical protein